MSSQCPCGSGALYGQCCGPLHDGTRSAATAEALMRSRYSAFVLNKADYLAATWHPSTRPEDHELSQGDERRWLGLKVKRHHTISENEAEVEFVARYREGGCGAVRQHEISRFVREAGRWLYLRGELVRKP